MMREILTRGLGRDVDVCVVAWIGQELIVAVALEVYVASFEVYFEVVAANIWRIDGAFDGEIQSLVVHNNRRLASIDFVAACYGRDLWDGVSVPVHT